MTQSLVFIGAPGSGKGTQSKKLVDNMGFNHISTGDLLRSEITRASELGNKVKVIMEQGNLVSDELVVELLKANLKLAGKKYIFDGYPRNISQAMTLNDEILEGHDYTAVYFNVDTEKLVKRLTNRRVSADGKHIYNLLTNPPEVDGICNFTGQTLVHRDDDREEVIRQRMEVFKSTVQPMIDYYKEKGNLCVLEADRTVDEVFTELKNL